MGLTFQASAGTAGLPPPSLPVRTTGPRSATHGTSRAARAGVASKKTHGVSKPWSRRSRDEKRAAVLRGTARFLLFYVTTALLIVGGVAVHEYSHYAAHEGLDVPAVTYSDGVREAQRDLLEVERSRGPAGDVLVHQPRETTIVIYPNTFLQAAGLGLLPAQAYQDDGVLASTYFRLEGDAVGELQARGGEMPMAVVAAPIWVAMGVFLLAFAWAVARPNLFNKALLVAYAVQLGDAGHHAVAFGMGPELFYALSTVAIMLAAVLVGLRTISIQERRRQAALGPAAKCRPKSSKPARKAFVRGGPLRRVFQPSGTARPGAVFADPTDTPSGLAARNSRGGVRLVVRAPPRRVPGGALSVRAPTDNSRTRRVPKPIPAIRPVTWT